MNHTATAAIAQHALLACGLDAQTLVQKHFGDFSPFEARAAKAANDFALEITFRAVEAASPIAFGLFEAAEQPGSQTRDRLIGMAISKLSGQLAHRDALDQLHHPGLPSTPLSSSTREVLVKAGAAALAVDMSAKEPGWAAIAGIGVAGIAVRHMGNPIPPGAYDLAREIQSTMQAKFAAAPASHDSQLRTTRRARP
ncbi:hypothetical protein ABIC83_002546 [Roseateles asaccharophilus]|uniref:hypothetical protein n=1 Tax=Roseateles asaccharophilus TaxID=582607 RepID=UPI0038351E8D